MKVEEALQLVTNVCSDFKGNLKDHQLIQQALATIRSNLEKQDVEQEVKTDIDS
jgi:hypothetical protein